MCSRDWGKPTMVQCHQILSVHPHRHYDRGYLPSSTRVIAETLCQCTSRVRKLYVVMSVNWGLNLILVQYRKMYSLTGDQIAAGKWNMSSIA